MDHETSEFFAEIHVAGTAYAVVSTGNGEFAKGFRDVEVSGRVEEEVVGVERGGSGRGRGEGGRASCGGRGIVV